LSEERGAPEPARSSPGKWPWPDVAPPEHRVLLRKRATQRDGCRVLGIPENLLSLG